MTLDPQAGALAGGVIGMMAAVLFLVRRSRPKVPPKTSATAARDAERANAWVAAQSKVQVTLEGDLLTVTAANGRTEQVDLAAVRNISLVTNVSSGTPLRSLELTVRRRVSVPLLAQGFETFLQHLRALPGFDFTTYQKTLTTTNVKRRTVFRANLPVNAKLASFRSPEVLLAEFERGLTVSAHGNPEERWLSLDNTTVEFAEKSNASFDRNEFDAGIFHAAMVRLGDLHLDEIQTRLPIGPANRPLLALEREIVLAERDETYWMLKKYFSTFLGPGKGWERNDSNHWDWEWSGLQVRLVYWYDSDYSAESGYCSFHLTNTRSYPEYLRDQYTDAVDWQQLKTLILPFERQGPTKDFRKTGWVKQTPPALLALLDRGDKYIVWNDLKNQRIGFALGSDALIVPYEECGEIRLLNAKPARGGGYSQLRITEVGNTEQWSGHQAGIAGYNELVRWREALQDTLARPVLLIDNLYDD